MIRFIVMAIGFISIGAVLSWNFGPTKVSSSSDQVSRADPSPISLQPALVAATASMAVPKVQPEPVAGLSSVIPEKPVAPVKRPVARPVTFARVPQTRPKARPIDFAPVLQPTVPVIPQSSAVGVAVAKPAPLPAQPAPKPVVVPQAIVQAPAPKAPSSGSGNEGVLEALRTMSYGLVKDGQVPAAKPAQPANPAVPKNAQLLPKGVVLPTPGIATPKPAKAEPAGQIYLVQEGDSLPGIAFRFYGTTVAYLKVLNANPDLLTTPADLKAGMVLKIPDTP